MTQRRRSGFALFAMLSIVAAAGVTVGALADDSRIERQASRNRTQLMQARWEADGCAAREMAAIAAALLPSQSPREANVVWDSLDSVLVRSSLMIPSECIVAAQAVGVTVDINRISVDQLTQLLNASGAGGQVDSLVDAFMDWRDADDEPGPTGAERAWYESIGRPVPSNGPFSATSELHLVRGFEDLRSIESLFSTESHRVVLDRAPRAVLATLPGLSSEAVDWIDSHRADLRGRDISIVMEHVSPPTRAGIMQSYTALNAAVTPVPDAWSIGNVVSLRDGVSLAVAYTFVRSGSHAHVVARREWIP